MGLFDKKYCDFCGNKIGLLGNRKLEDDNMCKECASKLSPWFSERRHSTKAEISEQLAYREANKQAVMNFKTTRTIGNYMKLLLDERNQKFIVTSASDLVKANPDVLDYSQATGCSLEIKESRSELKTKDAEGKSVSYNPPRYEYSYNFFVTIHVNTPYFDDIGYSISNGYINVGERPMNTAQSGWRVSSNSGAMRNTGRYYECVDLGNEIKAAVENMQRIARGEAPGAAAGAAAGVSGAAAGAAGAGQPVQEQPARGPVECPYCGATTTPDAKGCCEYCGSKIGA